MAKIITKGGICSTKNSPMGFQFMQQAPGKYTLGGSFGAAGDGVVASDEAITGDVSIASSYSTHGCRLCGKKYAYVCPACGAVVCDDGNGKNNVTCPSCKSTLDIARAVGVNMPKATVVSKTSFTVNKGEASDNGPYTKWAGVSVIEGAAKDAYGNAQGSQYDLAKDGAFKGYTIFVLDQLGCVFKNNATATLQKKGFKVICYNNGNISHGTNLANVLNTPDSQFWILSDSCSRLPQEDFGIIYEYYMRGHGVYIMGDNAPLYYDSNILLKQFFGNSVYLSGDYFADKILGIQQAAGQPGIIANHPISTGLVNFYEGITISSVNMGNSDLKPLIYNSECGIVSAYYDKDGRRTLIDGGWTRLYNDRITRAGTDRFIVNAAAWLANIERFGYHKH